MATKSSTYTHESGAQETVTLTRGPGTPRGHALLIIDCNDDQYIDCYVNTAWLRDRLDDLGEPRRTAHRPLTPDAITDEMVLRFMNSYDEQLGRAKPAPTLNYFTAHRTSVTRNALADALTEPPARPEGAEDIEAAFGTWERAEYLHAALDADDLRSIADHIAEEMNR